MKKLEEGEIVLCTVDKISGTTVFLKIDDNGEGTMITSEVAPGRIRNLRDYVVPNKKIVCKVLRIDENRNVHLSLRRVTPKERKELMDRNERERNIYSISKTVLKDKTESVMRDIKEKEGDLISFFDLAKENPKELYKYFNKDEADKISSILKEKKEKSVEIKKEFRLISKKYNGILVVKEILMPYSQEIRYLAAGKFVVKIIATDYKKANTILNEILLNIEKKAKEEKLEFEALGK